MNFRRLRNAMEKGTLDITIQADGHVCMSGPAVRIMEGEMII